MVSAGSGGAVDALALFNTPHRYTGGGGGGAKGITRKMGQLKM